MVVLWGQKMGWVSEKEMDKVADWIGWDWVTRTIREQMCRRGTGVGEFDVCAQSLIVDLFFYYLLPTALVNAKPGHNVMENLYTRREVYVFLIGK